MIASSYKNNFEIMAESFRDVIGMFNFLDFQIPVKVSTKMANPIKNKIPDIGKKNAPIIPSNFGNARRIFASKTINCNFIYLQIDQQVDVLKIIQAQPRQILKTKNLRTPLQPQSNKQRKKTKKLTIEDACS